MVATNNQPDNGVDLKEIIDLFLDKKFFIFAVTSLFAIGSILYSLSLTNIYTSSVTLAPVKNSQTAPNMSPQLGSLASMAGINLQAGSSTETAQYIKKLQSFSFFEDIISSSEMLPFILAVDTWDSNSNEVIFDKDKYNDIEKKWVANNNYLTGSRPSNQEAFIKFSKMLKVTKELETGFINISISHESPYISRDWLFMIVDKINNTARKEDKENSENAIKFLNNQISQTQISEIREVLSSLLQNQIQTLMLAEGSKDYLFKVIDPPYASEFKSSPNRSLICIFATFFGLLVSLIYVLIIHFYKKN